MAATILEEETLLVETSMMAATLTTLVEETALATKVVTWEDLEAKETRTQASTINSSSSNSCSSSSRVDLEIKWEGVVVETTETKAMRLAMLAQGLTRAPAVETSTHSLTMDKALTTVDQAMEDRCHQE